MPEFTTKSHSETTDLGRKIGSGLSSGEVVAIEGELGAGKTTFIKGIAQGLGVEDFVSSPTFVIVNEYSGRIPFYHMDLYRIEDAPSLNDLGVTEYFDGGGVVAIEWAERLGGLLPEKYLSVMIETIDEDRRRIIVEERGGKSLKGGI